MPNTFSNEFLPGCDYTVVDIDGALMDLIAARGETFRNLKARDSSLWQLRFWDWRPCCFNSFDTLDAMVPTAADSDFVGWIEKSGGWVVVGDVMIPENVIICTDCQTMTIMAEGGDVEVRWVFNLKDSAEVIRTVGVNLINWRRGLTDEEVHGAAVASRPCR